MKFFNNYMPALVCTLLLLIISCVKDDNFDTPDTTTTTLKIDGTVLGIDALYNLWLQELTNNENEVLTFTETNSYISGYVISSDEAGNFFEELLVQDAPVNPSRGVKILIDKNPLFTSYELGRKVFISLDGLTVGLTGGALSLGVRDGNEIEKLSESVFEEFVQRDTIVASITPLPLRISEFSVDKTNMYISLEDVQFNRNEVLGENRKTFAGEPDDEFDGERTLEDCAEGTSVVFSTSTFADFKAVLLPQGRGSLEGILTLDFFGETFNVVVNDPSTIHLDDVERCDPSEVSCGVATTTGSNILFSEYFETQSEGDPIAGNGWTNYMEAGTESWEAYSSSGSNASLGISARIGSFMSGDDSTVGWLITPAIDFDNHEGETLEFKTSNSFADGSTLEVLFSNDWDGDSETIPLVSWELVSDAYVVQDDDFFGDWPTSGKVDLSCVSGQGYIGWRFTGSGDADFDGTYELDEIEISAQE